VVGPEPRRPLLDVLRQGLGVGVHRLLGDGEAHVGVHTVRGGVWEEGHAVPVEPRPEGGEGEEEKKKKKKKNSRVILMSVCLSVCVSVCLSVCVCVSTHLLEKARCEGEQ